MYLVIRGICELPILDLTYMPKSWDIDEDSYMLLKKTQIDHEKY